jgi:outer membrane protein assembly factor BamB
VTRTFHHRQTCVRTISLRRTVARTPHAQNAPRAPHRVLAATLVALAILATDARADTRCGIELQRNVCRDANPLCPGSTRPLGPNPGSWPTFQRDAQHTGWSPVAGPTCGNLLWSTKLRGSIFSSAALAQPTAGEPETLYVPVGKAPVCALDPVSGAVKWCNTSDLGKLVDRSSPAIGNGSLIYVGTRDNDLWAIDATSADSGNATVAWRQKVCTDGDVTTPPTVGYDGIVYMGSDSLGAGTVMAMCPGDQRQLKWCVNPVGGGGVRNASPALSLNGEHLYITVGAHTLAAFDPEVGTELWRVQFEKPSGVGRQPNYSPVVNPLTGMVYLGTNKGIWEIEHHVDEVSGKESASARLLFDTAPYRERVYSPPALDPLRGVIVFGASRGNTSTLYAIGLDGSLKWRKPMPRGRFRNNPAVTDVDGRIYVAFGKAVHAIDEHGNTLWTVPHKRGFSASPILAAGRLYVGTTDGTMLAIGCP